MSKTKHSDMRGIRSNGSEVSDGPASELMALSIKMVNYEIPTVSSALL